MRHRKPLSQESPASGIPARFAYTALDGDPPESAHQLHVADTGQAAAMLKVENGTRGLKLIKAAAAAEVLGTATDDLPPFETSEEEMRANVLDRRLGDDYMALGSVLVRFPQTLSELKEHVAATDLSQDQLEPETTAFHSLAHLDSHCQSPLVLEADGCSGGLNCGVERRPRDLRCHGSVCDPCRSP